MKLEQFISHHGPPQILLIIKGRVLNPNWLLSFVIYCRLTSAGQQHTIHSVMAKLKGLIELWHNPFHVCRQEPKGLAGIINWLPQVLLAYRSSTWIDRSYTTCLTLWMWSLHTCWSMFPLSCSTINSSDKIIKSMQQLFNLTAWPILASNREALIIT